MNDYRALIFFVSCTVSASEYPIVTSIQTRITSSKTATYTGTINVMDIGSAADVLVPPRWIAGLGHRHDNFPGGKDVVSMYSSSFSCDAGGCSIDTTANMTLGQAAMAAYRKWGRSNFVINHQGQGNGGECVGFLAAATFSTSPWGSALTPAGSCIYAPPGQDWCNIVTPVITFNHGVLRLTEAEGHSVSIQTNINCTLGTTVRLRLIDNQSFIDLKDGLRSDIFIEGKPPAVALALQAGTNMVNMSDKLVGVTKSGDFTGSGVLVLEPQ